jgi:hypothetical protein
MRNEPRAQLLKIDCVALAALACYAVSATLLVPDLLAHMAGTILCFVLTGLALASAVAPRPMSPAARFTTIVACVLGTGIVGGLIVNYLPGGIVRFNWVTYALVVTLIGWAVARARGASGPVRWGSANVAAPTIGAAVKVTGSILIVTAAVVISLASTNSGEKPFTELWLVPDTPGQQPTGATRAELGIKNHESTVENYTVVMDTGKQIMTNRVTLAPNQVWSQNVPLEGAKAVAELYRGDNTENPFRTVWIVTN